MKKNIFLIGLILIVIGCKKDDDDKINKNYLQLSNIKIGEIYLNQNDTVEGISVDKNIIIELNDIPDTNSVRSNIALSTLEGQATNFKIAYMDDNRKIVIIPIQSLSFSTKYKLSILNGLKGIQGETFPGTEYYFITQGGKLLISQISLNGNSFNLPAILKDIDYKNVKIEIEFSDALDPSNYKSFFVFSTNPAMNYSLSNENKKVTITTINELEDYSRYFMTISGSLQSINGYAFEGFSNFFYTSLDSTYKFPVVSDDELLTIIQQQTFKYFWDYGHPVSGLTYERWPSSQVVTIGGSGFGVMALVVGMERGFITRAKGLERLDTILNFLASAERFHGVWPHWLNGTTGEAFPFSTYDDGGDLVETSYLVMGLLTMRQYLNSANAYENQLIGKINNLWESVEWNWYTRGGQNKLYWHWSENFEWQMNMPIRGYNEALITHICAAASPTYGVDSTVYHEGWAVNGAIKNGREFYGYVLPLGPDYGGPLFFEQYTFLGINPTGLSDRYANYWDQVKNHTLINRAYCIDNPKDFIGYSASCWGLTASDNHVGYSAHSPTNDLGVITPTAAISSIAFTPVESMVAIRHFYYVLGDRLLGEHGFYDAFSPSNNWWGNSYLAIDQGPIINMIENYRSGLLWNLFMSCPEIQSALEKLDFTY